MLFVHFVSANLSIDVAQKQALLEMTDLKARAMAVLGYMDVELQKLQLKNDIQSKVRNDLDQQQREYFLHQQMKTIQENWVGSPMKKRSMRWWSSQKTNCGMKNCQTF